MKAELRPIRDGDIEAICANPRSADVAEMEAMGKGFEDALVESVRVSDWVACGTVDDRPVCLFGVAPISILGAMGAPWMLAAADLDAADVRFLRHFIPACRSVVEAMRATYPRLVNIVDARNTRAIRWLKWLGFTFDMPPVYVQGHMFHVFRMRD